MSSFLFSYFELFLSQLQCHWKKKSPQLYARNANKFSFSQHKAGSGPAALRDAELPENLLKNRQSHLRNGFFLVARSDVAAGGVEPALKKNFVSLNLLLFPKFSSEAAF